VFAFNALGEPGLNLLATGLTGFSLAVLLWGLHGVYKQFQFDQNREPLLVDITD